MRTQESDIYKVYGEFLSGRKRDIGRRFHDVSVPTIVDRINYLQQRCTGKKVLHVGCLDHPEIILQRVDNGTWLHGILSQVTDLCVGIDVDPSAYDIARSKLKMADIQLLDLTAPLENEDLKRLSLVEWDLILCPEVLEHTTNHQTFLTNLGRLAHPNTTLIVTAPNAFRFHNFVNTMRRYESINSDHKYWFTFYTLSSLLASTGWRPRELIYYEQSRANKALWRRSLSYLARTFSRSFSEGLIIEAVRDPR